MQVQPVAVVLLSLFRFQLPSVTVLVPVSLLIACLAITLSVPARAELDTGESVSIESAQVEQGQVQQKFLAHIKLHTSVELGAILERADQLHAAGKLETEAPIVFVLHGPEGKVFLRQSYGDNKALVDLAARLSALEVIDIQVCETWMGFRGIEKKELVPFVGTVPLGPAEERRLMKESYTYF